MKFIFLAIVLVSEASLATVFLTYDQATQKYYDGRKPMDRSEIKELNAIAQIYVEGHSLFPSKSCSKHDIQCDIQNGICDRSTTRCTEIKEGPFAAGFNRNIGSGFAINECLIVTNHHVAFQARSADRFEASKIEVRLGESKDAQNPFAFVSSARVIKHGNYPELASKFDEVHDWAILKTDKSIYNPKDKEDPRRRWSLSPRFKTFRDVARNGMISAAFSQDNALAKVGKVLLGDDCRIKVRSSYRDIEVTGNWEHTCPSIPGNSGAPIMGYEKQADGKDKLVVYAAVTKGAEYDKEKVGFYPQDKYNGVPEFAFYNVGIPFSAMMTEAELAQIIQDNKCPKSY